MEEKKDKHVIFLHGFSKDQAVAIMRSVKAAVENPREVAFSMSTPTNVEWKVKDLISEVAEEHEYMMTHGRPKPE